MIVSCNKSQRERERQHELWFFYSHTIPIINNCIFDRYETEDHCIMTKPLFFLVLLTLLSCSPEEKKTETTAPAVEGTETSFADTLSEMIATKDVYSWLKEHFKIDVPVSKRKQLDFDTKNYEERLSAETLAELNEDWWMKNVSFNGIEFYKDGIVIDLSSEDFSKNLILTKDFFTISYHLLMGSDGQTMIYHFKKKTLTLDPEIYAMYPISAKELMVGKDYYDFRDVEDPDYAGHIFEKGTYHLETGKYTFLERE